MSDNISRQDAIEAVCANCLRQDLDVFDGCLDEDCSIKPVLESLPSTDPWIPFSERFPEEHEWIGTKRFGTTISDKVHITFDVNGERFVKTLSLQNGELSNHEKHIMDTFYKGWKMIAWMPLPEPWEGGYDAKLD